MNVILLQDSPEQDIHRLMEVNTAVNARIKALNPNDPDYDTKLLEFQTLETEAQSILDGLLGP